MIADKLKNAHSFKIKEMRFKGVCETCSWSCSPRSKILTQEHLAFSPNISQKV